jgi:murein DD-endopeptidase MepM/ murein hydrolase activator NlpD
MQKLRPLLKKLATPVTIMLVPHTRTSSLNFKVPTAALWMLLAFSGIGLIYTLSLTWHAIDYYVMKQKYTRMSGEFQEMKSTIDSLKESESEFKRLFSLGSKKKVLDSYDQGRGDGSIDIDELKRDIKASMDSVAEIKKYLSKEQDSYLATPQGFPVAGRLSSGFGMRRHPKYGGQRFHSGVDLSIASGTPVHATADGVVSFSGWSQGNGNVVVIEHGHGYSTVYAHNSANIAKVGQTVKRGEKIAAVGATGVTTGPHVHYEVWKNGRCINPVQTAEEQG